MDCPNCGTWNPDDKDVCWRCQHPLPKPVKEEKKKPKQFFGLPLWAWIILIVVFIAPTLAQCLFIGGPPTQ